MRSINKKSFGGKLYREIQRFSDKRVAQSYAKGLRKRGINSQPVNVRVTLEPRGYVVWIRGKI